MLRTSLRWLIVPFFLKHAVFRDLLQHQLKVKDQKNIFWGKKKSNSLPAGGRRGHREMEKSLWHNASLTVSTEDLEDQMETVPIFTCSPYYCLSQTSCLAACMAT